MRRLSMMLLSLPLLVGAPAGAASPLVAGFAGIGYELCPASPGFGCSYEGWSLACNAVTGDYSTPCETHLNAATGPCTDSVTAGTFTYSDEVGTAYSIRVTVRNGAFTGSVGTTDGTVTVSGTLFPFAGTVTRGGNAPAAPALAKGNCPTPI